MSDQDYWTMEAMEKFGGSFVKSLAAMARRADPINLQKIKTTWPEYWEEYERMGTTLEKTIAESK